MKERLIDEKPKKLTTTCGNKWKSLRGKKKEKTRLHGRIWEISVEETSLEEWGERIVRK